MSQTLPEPVGSPKPLTIAIDTRKKAHVVNPRGGTVFCDKSLNFLALSEAENGHAAKVLIKKTPDAKWCALCLLRAKGAGVMT